MTNNLLELFTTIATIIVVLVVASLLVLWFVPAPDRVDLLTTLIQG